MKCGWINDGDGVFAESQQNLSRAEVLGLAVADFDDDGLIDFATGNYFPQPNEVWLNTEIGELIIEDDDDDDDEELIFLDIEMR